MPRYQCDECHGKVFVDLDAYKGHVKKQKHRPYQCPRCLKSYLKEKVLQTHFNSKARKTGKSHNIYSCHGCDKTFNLEGDLIAHVQDLHPEKCCHICGYMVAVAEWDTHLQQSPSHKLCSRCDLFFETQEQYARHVALPHDALFCALCDEFFHTQDSLDKHREGAENHYRCNICNHLAGRHSTTRNVQAENVPVQEDDKRPVDVDVLLQVRDAPDAGTVLQVEPERGIPSTPQCSVCNQRYPRFGDLIQHSLCSHPDVYGLIKKSGSVACPNCTLKFKNKTSMYQHMFAKCLSPDEAIRFLNQLRSTMQGSPVTQEDLSISAAGAGSSERAFALSSGYNTPVGARSDVDGDSEGPSTQPDAGSPIPISGYLDSEILAEDQSRSSSRSSSFSPSMSDPVLVSDPEEHVSVLSEDDDPSSIADGLESDPDLLASSEEPRESTPAALDIDQGELPPSDSVSEQTATSTREVPAQDPPSVADILNAPQSRHGPAAREDAPPVLLHCGVCRNPPTRPLVTLCGHVFCHGCAMVEIFKTLQCPTCRVPIFVRLDVASK